IPIGCGTNFSAIHKGFKEMKEGGLIDEFPKLVAIQPDQSSPVVDGIFKKEKIVKDQVQTMDTSVADPDPVDFYKVLKAIDESDGMAFTVTEDEILDALKELRSEEHTSELQSRFDLVCRLLLEKKNRTQI